MSNICNINQRVDQETYDREFTRIFRQETLQELKDRFHRMMMEDANQPDFRESIDYSGMMETEKQLNEILKGIK